MAEFHENPKAKRSKYNDEGEGDAANALASNNSMILPSIDESRLHDEVIVDEVHVGIVDDHHEIIYFLHSQWKGKHLPFDGLVLVHFDAHPDLDPPKGDVTKFADTSYLYDILDQPGGISEFILPMALNGHFNKGIVWIKPYWNEQFRNGIYSFQVGNNLQNVAAVTLLESYYLDDGVVYNRNELMFDESHDPVSLLVCSEETNFQSIAPPIEASSQPWILDICLDFFTVSNPFVAELSKEFEKQQQLSITFPEFMRKLTAFYQALNFRIVDDSNKMSIVERRRQRLEFLDTIAKILSQLSQEGEIDNTMLTRFILLFSQDHLEALLEFIKVMKALPPSILQQLSDVEFTLIATLPHHPSTICEILTALERFELQLFEICYHYRSKPVSVTIARSDGDGYTPALATFLQESVLAILGRLFGEDDGSSMSAEETKHEHVNMKKQSLHVHDLREEPLLSARKIFITKNTEFS